MRRLVIDVSYSLSLTRRPCPPGRAELPSSAYQSSEQPYRGLSDEISVQIFEEWHSAYQHYYGPTVPPLHYLLVSKRLYSIARPIWLSTISTHDDAEYFDRLIAKLMTDATIRPLVRRLEITLHGAFSQSQIAILTMLENLRILEVDFDDDWPTAPGRAKSIPAALLDAIASCPHLEELKFIELVEAKSHSPEPVNKRPLQVFTAPIHSLKASLLDYLNARQVKTLKLTVDLGLDQPFTGHFPWEDLSTVKFELSIARHRQAATCKVPEALGRQVRVAVSYPFLPFPGC